MRRIRRHLLLIVPAVLLALQAKSARTDDGYYSYRDGKGVLHLTNVHTDRRYRPVYPSEAPRQKKKIRREVIYRAIETASRKYSVDPALIKAIVKAESNFDPHAVSHAGAIGLMQLMPETADDLNIVNPYDPHENIQGGVRHFSSLLRAFEGDITLAVAAYNAGRSNVIRHGGIPPYRQTINYVKKVLGYFESYRNTGEGH